MIEFTIYRLTLFSLTYVVFTILLPLFSLVKCMILIPLLRTLKSPTRSFFFFFLKFTGLLIFMQISWALHGFFLKLCLFLLVKRLHLLFLPSCFACRLTKYPLNYYSQHLKLFFLYNKPKTLFSKQQILQSALSLIRIYNNACFIY